MNGSGILKSNPTETVLLCALIYGNSNSSIDLFSHIFTNNLLVCCTFLNFQP